jgi:hypothetical protein
MRVDAADGDVGWLCGIMCCRANCMNVLTAYSFINPFMCAAVLNARHCCAAIFGAAVRAAGKKAARTITVVVDGYVYSRLLAARLSE